MPTTALPEGANESERAAKRLEKKGWTVVNRDGSILLSKPLSQRTINRMIQASHERSPVYRVKVALGLIKPGNPKKQVARGRVVRK